MEIQNQNKPDDDDDMKIAAAATAGAGAAAASGASKESVKVKAASALDEGKSAVQKAASGVNASKGDPLAPKKKPSSSRSDDDLDDDEDAENPKLDRIMTFLGIAAAVVIAAIVLVLLVQVFGPRGSQKANQNSSAASSTQASSATSNSASSAKTSSADASEDVKVPSLLGKTVNEVKKEYANSVGIPVLQPEKMKAPVFIEQLQSYHPDLQVVVAFRMLPEIVWNMPRFGTFNVHASLLPQYRGAAPINWAIINGETKTGVTTFFLDHEIDTGRIIMQKEFDIPEEADVEYVYDHLMELGAQTAIETIEMILEGDGVIETTSQQEMIVPVYF